MRYPQLATHIHEALAAKIGRTLIYFLISLPGSIGDCLACCRKSTKEPNQKLRQALLQSPHTALNNCQRPGLCTEANQNLQYCPPTGPQAPWSSRHIGVGMWGAWFPASNVLHTRHTLPFVACHLSHNKVSRKQLLCHKKIQTAKSKQPNHKLGPRACGWWQDPA
jgi:hypothetical protein